MSIRNWWQRKAVAGLLRSRGYPDDFVNYFKRVCKASNIDAMSLTPEAFDKIARNYSMDHAMGTPDGLRVIMQSFMDYGEIDFSHGGEDGDTLTR